MNAKYHKTNSKEILYDSLNEKLKILDTSIGENIRCPLCWNLFSRNALQAELSIEHIPPSATAKLLKEKIYKTLTCKKCNNTFGAECHSHLHKFVIFQLHQHGKYNTPIRGTITMKDNELIPLKSNIVFTAENLKITGVPKANAVSTTQSHISTWDSISKSSTTGWNFTVSLNYDCILSTAWLAYLQVAYLMLYIVTNCYYAFTKAGTEIRNSLIQGDTNKVGPCVITPSKIGVGGKPWIAKVTEPNNLKCLWVKVAGNIVILPLPDDDSLSCYKAWQSISEQTHFGLRPRKTHLKINFYSREDSLAAQQCVVLTPEE